MLGEAMAQKRAKSAHFWPRPPARQAVRVGVVPAGRPRHACGLGHLPDLLAQTAGPPTAAFGEYPQRIFPRRICPALVPSLACFLIISATLERQGFAPAKAGFLLDPPRHPAGEWKECRQAKRYACARREVRRVKRSMKAGKKDPMDQLLDILGPRLADVEDFCLTDLNIRVGQDPQDVQRAATAILSRVQRQLKSQKRKK